MGRGVIGNVFHKYDMSMMISSSINHCESQFIQLLLNFNNNIESIRLNYIY